MGIAGEEVIGKEVGRSPGLSDNHIDIFYGAWLSSPFSGIYILCIYIYMIIYFLYNFLII